MKTKISTEFSISQKQKRLSYWEAKLSTTLEQHPLILENLTTYRMLLSRLAKASHLSTKEEVDETNLRLIELERLIENHFDNWRLSASPIGQCNVTTEPD